MKTIGYVRVSTDKQAERGVSLEAQAEKIRAMALIHKAELLPDNRQFCVTRYGLPDRRRSAVIY